MIPILLLGVLLMATSEGEHKRSDPLVIAHRGASGHLPEHTLPAFALAYGQGADFLEPDVVLTRDGQPVVLHDLTLDATSDVRERFAGRARADGLHYVIDFTLDELRQLAFGPRLDPATGAAVFPARVLPGRIPGQPILTLEELIQFTKALNATLGRRVGIYPEIKAPAFHASEGQDIAAIVLELLRRHGLDDPAAPVFLQSFEPESLKRLREELGARLRLVQLLGENAWAMNEVDYEPLYRPEGLAQIATYADAIGPPIPRVLRVGDEDPRPGQLVRDAHALGLAVHPYTFRSDALPAGIDAQALLDLLLGDIGVDGLFIDQPELMIDWIRQRRRR